MKIFFNMSNLLEYIKCQRFIVKSELDYHWSNMNLNISQSDFLDKTLGCIFDSLEKIAESIEEKK
ncbi:MAG: hypothetical protein FJW56_04420 [Actinobacteria bacterium]|nr:hypothetical protein [Actinomycetota bacterium]